jgi:beta-phosphoglucomutase-like phosphatase (HAD superfamily)
MMDEHPDAGRSGQYAFRAVLWDIDGTLLLSEDMHFRALRHALATEWVEVPDEFHHEIVGRAAKVVYEKCRQTFGLSMSFDQWRRLKYSYYTAHAAEIAGRPGALEAWRLFEQSGLRQALVSNSDRIAVNANIRVLGLWKRPGSYRCRSMTW